MDLDKLAATSAQFNTVVDADETSIAQQITDANRKCLALRPSALNSHSNAPCFVRLQELQETFEKQLKQTTEVSMRKLHELCEQQKTDFAELYGKEKARLLRALNK